MPVPHAGLLSWRVSVTLALCVGLSASTVGCATFSDDTHTGQHAKSDLTSSHDQESVALPSSHDTSDSVAAARNLEWSFQAASQGEPAWSVMGKNLTGNPFTGSPMVPYCPPLAALKVSDETDLCSRLDRRALKTFSLQDDVPLRPPSRQLWFHHPRLIPVRGEESQIRRPYGEHDYRDRVSDDTFRNPYTGLRDLPLLHSDTTRATVTDSELSDIGPPPPHHTLKTAVTLVGLTLLGAGMYAFGPSSFTGADTEENVWEEARDHFKEAWKKPPVFDKDGSGVNYVGHPFFGMQYYLSQRNYGESSLYSFLFSVGTSTFFEYFVESWSERPSVQDLIITPVVGSILGELVYQATQHMRKDGFTQAEKIMVTIINPLYVLQNGYH